MSEEIPLEDEEQAESNVYSIYGEEYVPPPEAGGIDPNTVFALKDAVALAASGELHHIVIMGYNPKTGRYQRVITEPRASDPITETNHLLRLIGVLEMTKRDILSYLSGMGDYEE